MVAEGAPVGVARGHRIEAAPAGRGRQATPIAAPHTRVAPAADDPSRRGDAAEAGASACRMGADRTRAALEQVKAQGGRLGGEALGWRRLDAVDDCGWRVVEAVPDELAAVDRAVELRRQGATLQAIAQALNAEGLPTKRGAVWRAGTVRAVLMRVG